MRAIETTLEGPKGIASSRLFNLDDVCSKIRQKHRSGGAGNEDRCLFIDLLKVADMLSGFDKGCV
jgi:hypothetical protein